MVRTRDPNGLGGVRYWSSRGKQILVHAGTTVGDVVVVGNDLVGDGVNIAAQRQALTIPRTYTLSDFDQRSSSLEPNIEPFEIEN